MQDKDVLKRVMANTGWNILGLVLPLAVAMFAIPTLLKNIGTERFGILSLVWVCIGYFALFDLGLGRAVTKIVSELEINGRQEELDSVCLTTTVVAGLLGCLGGLLLMVIVWCFPGLIDGITTSFQSEIYGAVSWVALCIPVVVLTAVLRGILEGVQRFRVLNLIRGPSGALLFLLPALASLHTPSLTWLVGMTVIARVIMFVAHYLPCRSLLLVKRKNLSMHWAKPLFSFGGWFTVANLVSPVIVYLDRFVLAAVLPLANLAYYTAPFEIVSKVLNIPAAVTSALFPALNRTRQIDPLDALRLKKRAQTAVFGVMLGIVVVGVAVSSRFIGLWLGESFVEMSAPVMQTLLVGFGFNALAQVTYVSLQSEGKVKSVAYLQLIELPLYAALLWCLINLWGIQGAAIAWAVRSFLDWMMLEFILYFSGSLSEKARAVV